MTQGKKVVVGLSGGVDSSVAALLLQQQGYEVIGMFMKNWHDTSVTISDDCPWEEDSKDALLVAEKLGIPFQTIDLSEQYRKRIVDYMFAEYKAGRTPNPDVLCNREIKFDVFLQAALGLGADYVATGHYCRKDQTQINGMPVYHLLSGLDKNKDQSYFLCQINQFQLSKALFPIGHLQKAEVRNIAKEFGLTTAAKKDSQGLCFIGKVKLPEFLQQQLKPQSGDIIRIDDSEVSVNEETELDKLVEPHHFSETMGQKVGIHNGAHYYTVGQRKGLRVGGMAEPLFVLATDTTKNVVYTGMGELHPGLYRKGLFIPSADIHWIRPDLALKSGETRTYMIRIRYRQALQRAELYCRNNGMYIVFDEPQRGITPGQFAAWYAEDELIGSGVIE